MRKRSRPTEEPNASPAKASWGFAEGDQFAPGRIALKSIGGGKAFETYLAWDDRLFSIVVAKMIRPDKVDDPQTLAALQREAEALAHLSHPLVVRSFGAVLDGPHPHIVLEHLEGPSLTSLIRKHAPLPVEQILPLAVDLCSALHYFEVEGWVHLDVKPLNVIMGAAPKLIDLSLARTIERAHELTTPVGTRAYMSPEQREPGVRGEVGPPADVWGLGVTVYEALTGLRPFDVDEDGWPKLDVAPRPLPKELKGPVADMVISCLEPEPADRPSASRLAIALGPAVEALTERKVIRRGRPRLR